MSDERLCGLDRDEVLGMLRRMIEIRLFENEIMNLFSRNLLRASTHLCQGRRRLPSAPARPAVGRHDDLYLPPGTAPCLAMGAPLDRSFGDPRRQPGLCGGRGGSMHLTDVSVGALGSFAIVGICRSRAGRRSPPSTSTAAQCPPASLATALINIGAFHEAMNLASIWRLPVIFVCRGTTCTASTRRWPPPRRSPNSRSGRPALHDAGRARRWERRADRLRGRAKARARAAAGDGPTMIEALTYRHMGHSRSDPATYRPEGGARGMARA